MNGRQTNGNFFESAILNDEWAKPAIDCPTPCTLKTLEDQTGQGRTSSVLYIASATPLPLKLYTSSAVGAPPSCGVYTSWSLPGPGATKSVARYWSPNAWRPITIGLIHPGTGRGMRSRTIGSRKTVPPRILRIWEGVGEEERPRQRKVLWRKRRGWKGDAGKGAGAPGRTVVSRC